MLDEREREDRQVFIDSGSHRKGGLGVLRGMVRLAELNETRPALVRLFVVLSAEASEEAHPSHEYFQNHFTRVIEGTTRALDEVRDAQMLRRGVDPASFARELIALQDGLQLQWLLRPRESQIAGPLERRIQSVLRRPLWQDGPWEPGPSDGQYFVRT